MEVLPLVIVQSTLSLPSNFLSHIFNERCSLHVQVNLTQNSLKAKTTALVDSSAMRNFISLDFVEKHSLVTTPISHSIYVFNINGTENQARTISSEVKAKLFIDGYCKTQVFKVTNLEKQTMILGHEWLKEHNSEIDWSTNTVKMMCCPPTCCHFKKVNTKEKTLTTVFFIECGPDPEEEIDTFFDDVYLHLCCFLLSPLEELDDISASPESTYTNINYLKLAYQQVMICAENNTEVRKMIPDKYHEFLSVFSECTTSRLPVHKPWNYTIDFKPDFVPKYVKVYNLFFDEQKEVEDFLDKNLAKRYIQKFKSPQMSPVFFVGKKNRKKYMRQDYYYINEHIIQNVYPLPLISNLVDKIHGAKYFSKFDLCWGYNNLYIKLLEQDPKQK